MKGANRKPKKTLVFQISYLGGKLSFEKNVDVKGKELFMEVCQSLGIQEYWYFGLQYESTKGHPMWVRPNSKVGPLALKVTAPLFFLVKYFPEDIGRVKEDAALALIYRQCKISVVTGAVYTPPETSLLMASYILLAEQGESSCVDYSKLVVSDYLAPAVLEAQTLTHRMWIDKIKLWHKKHRGLSIREAQLEFMRIAQFLGMYGVSYFPAKFQGLPAWIGVHPKGINIYEDNLVVPKISLKWIFIRMIHYSCRKFIVKTTLSQVTEYSCYLKSLRLTRQVFEFAVGYHSLYLRSRFSIGNECRFSPWPTPNDETFNGLTEQLCRNDTFLKKGTIEKIKKKEVGQTPIEK